MAKNNLGWWIIGIIILIIVLNLTGVINLFSTVNPSPAGGGVGSGGLI